MVPNILRGGQTRYLSLWEGSCSRVLSRVIFWFFWDTLFQFFLSFPLVSISANIFRCPFLQAFWLLLDLVVWLLPSCIICHFSLLTWHIFLSQIPFLCLDCIFPQFILGFPILFRFWPKVLCCSCTSSGWSFLAIYWVCTRLTMWLIGIMAITNSNGDSASPWNMPLWIFTSAKLFPPAVNFTLQVSIVFSINCWIWSGILYILRQCSIPIWGIISQAFF